MRIFKIGSALAGVIAILGFLAAASFAQQDAARAVSGRLQNSGFPLPLVFEMNVGQVDARVKYLSRTHRGALFIESDQAVLVLSSPAVVPFRRGGNGHSAPIGRSEGVLAMRLIGANPIARVDGRGQNIARINYFIGRDPSRWHTNIPTVNEVVTRDAWPGIDVSYGRDPAAPEAVECVFTVRAGADLTSIRLAFDASGAIALTPDGDVEAVVAGRRVTFTRPKVFEESVDGRHEVAAKFVAITTKAQTASHQLQVRFEVARHDKAARLIIDPSLIYSTYFGGSGQPNASTIFDGTGDRVNAIALDKDGNEYLTGATTSPDFPASNDTFLAPCPSRCDPAFVTKIDGKTGAIIYSTLLGGGSGANEGLGYGDAGNGIAIDSSGNAYIAGATFSTNFPTTPGVLFPSCTSAGPVPFVTKLSADGSSLVYSTYLEGAAVQDYGNAIAIDGPGNAYVTGVINGNAFAIVLNGTGTAESYAVSLASATGYAVALTSNQEMWIGGQSNGKNFPTTSGAYQRKCAECDRERAGFVSLLNPSKGSTKASLAYSTYLGESSAGNIIRAIAVDSKNRAWAVGSADVSSLPGKKNDVHCTKGSNCGNHALLAIINASQSGGASLSGSEYFGGDGSDMANAIYLSGNTAYVGGQTTSSNFPVTSNAVQSSYTPCSGPCLTSRGPAFVLVVNPGSKKMSFSTILGGATVPSPTYSNGGNKILSLIEIDGVDGIAVDGNGVIHAAGLTYSSGFPTTSDAQERICKACATLGSDGFIARINPTAATGAEALEYSSFIGGGGPSSAGDYAAGVAMDNTGAVYVAGYTTSPDFPVTAGAFQQTCPGCVGYSLGGIPYIGFASFVAKLNPSAAPGRIRFRRRQFQRSFGYRRGFDGRGVRSRSLFRVRFSHYCERIFEQLQQ
jgi:Beta-propeller repeat